MIFMSTHDTVTHTHCYLGYQNTAVVSLASPLARGRGQSNMCNLEDQKHWTIRSVHGEGVRV